LCGCTCVLNKTHAHGAFWRTSTSNAFEESALNDNRGKVLTLAEVGELPSLSRCKC